MGQSIIGLEEHKDWTNLDIDNPYMVIPKEADVSELNIKFDYGESETVTAQYFYKDHLAGQVDFIVEGSSQGAAVREKGEYEELFNWKNIIFAIIVGVLAAVVFIKVTLDK